MRDTRFHAAVHNGSVNSNADLRPIPVFAATTRAVREAALPKAIRTRAYALLEALAGALGYGTAHSPLDELMTLAASCPPLAAALAPHAQPLQAMVALCASNVPHRAGLPAN